MIKYLTIITLAAAFLSLGACAHKQATTTTAAASTGYKK